MDKKTYDALYGSIAKWKGIVEGTNTDRGAENCPLCQLDKEHGVIWCETCPVYQATRNWGCDGTPYQDYDDISTSDQLKPTRLAIEIAQAEVEFLQSLVPAGGPDE